MVKPYAGVVEKHRSWSAPGSEEVRDTVGILHCPELPEIRRGRASIAHFSRLPCCRLDQSAMLLHRKP